MREGGLISCKEITSPINLEIICIKLLLPNPITICVTYVPPNSTVAYYNDLFNFFLNLHTASDKLIILGDFNFTDIDWDLLSGSSPVSDQFCDLIFQTGLSQLNDMPTHVHCNILDLLLTNVDDNICQLQIHSDQSLLPSDHFSIPFSVSVSCTSTKSATYFTFNYSKGDYQGLCDYLFHSDFTSCYTSHDIEYILHTIEHLLFSVMQLFIPVSKIHTPCCLTLT